MEKHSTDERTKIDADRWIDRERERKRGREIVCVFMKEGESEIDR